ncbi:hypothetical protein [Luteibacter aegosomatissinici]|uniref:hypothetical protein n=1 Tax=Luteibacter aegosomatissinici TaxID=2911539 RepID=UPI001FFBE2C5|nr:hypothetical protein [Luteibacter aegosomatissinici]UPG94863.1 hypothetical protein L2Y97_01795 [Luteibacter aegosomatissinici]
MKRLLATLLGVTLAPIAWAADPRGTDIDRPFNEYTWLTAHNAFANAPALLPAFLPNQTLSIGEQLQNGVRGLMLDVHESNGRVRLCHGTCIGVEPTLADTLETQILPFLERVPHGVVTLLLEDDTRREALEAELERTPKTAALTFNPASWGTAAWPTPRQMIEAGQRLVVFTQTVRNAGTLNTAGGPFHLLYDRDYTSENYWSLGTSVFEHDMSCRSRWESQPLYLDTTRTAQAWPRLFVMNHFHGVPFGNHSGSDNSYAVLRARIDDECAPAAQRKPNYIAVDFVEAGQARSVVAALNQGAIEFFDGPGGTGELVCAVPGSERRTVELGDAGLDRCPTARLRSAVLRDLPAGTRIVLSDGLSHAASRTAILVRKDLMGERATIARFSEAYDGDGVHVQPSANGLRNGITHVTFSIPR